MTNANGLITRETHDRICKDMKANIHGRIDTIWKTALVVLLAVLGSVGGAIWWARGVQAQSEKTAVAVAEAATKKDVEELKRNDKVQTKAINRTAAVVEALALKLDVVVPSRPAIEDSTE